jgi:hypothetical protein
MAYPPGGPGVYVERYYIFFYLILLHILLDEVSVRGTVKLV